MFSLHLARSPNYVSSRSSQTFALCCETLGVKFYIHFIGEVHTEHLVNDLDINLFTGYQPYASFNGDLCEASQICYPGFFLFQDSFNGETNGVNQWDDVSFTLAAFASS